MSSCARELMLVLLFERLSFNSLSLKWAMKKDGSVNCSVHQKKSSCKNWIYAPKNQNTVLANGVDKNCEHFLHIIAPHSRQWCLRNTMLNEWAHVGHRLTSLSGIQGTIDISYALKRRLIFSFTVNYLNLPQWIPFFLFSSFKTSVDTSLSNVIRSLFVCTTYLPTVLSRKALNSDVWQRKKPLNQNVSVSGSGSWDYWNNSGLPFSWYEFNWVLNPFKNEFWCWSTIKSFLLLAVCLSAFVDRIKVLALAMTSCFFLKKKD